GPGGNRVLQPQQALAALGEGPRELLEEFPRALLALDDRLAQQALRLLQAPCLEGVLGLSQGYPAEADHGAVANRRVLRGGRKGLNVGGGRPTPSPIIIPVDTVTSSLAVRSRAGSAPDDGTRAHPRGRRADSGSVRPRPLLVLGDLRGRRAARLI